MIIYDLKCRDGHKFEGWFKDRSAFEEQKAKTLIACPVCGIDDVTMIPSSVTIVGKEGHTRKSAWSAMIRKAARFHSTQKNTGRN